MNSVRMYDVEGMGAVRVCKLRGCRHIRLTFAADGSVRVTIPAWMAFDAGRAFAAAKESWIREHRPPQPALLQAGQSIGKSHRLLFAEAADVGSPRSRLSGSEIRVTHPAAMASAHPAVQTAARAGGIRALRSEAKRLLPLRLQQLAALYGYEYGEVRIKQLRSRWGSCDAHRNITLNLYLMGLPWQLIDYVLVHELVHTRTLNHGRAFWDELEGHLPRARELRRLLNAHHPAI